MAFMAMAALDNDIASIHFFKIMDTGLGLSRTHKQQHCRHIISVLNQIKMFYFMTCMHLPNLIQQLPMCQEKADPNTNVVLFIKRIIDQVLTFVHFRKGGPCLSLHPILILHLPISNINVFDVLCCSYQQFQLKVRLFHF